MQAAEQTTIDFEAIPAPALVVLPPAAANGAPQKSTNARALVAEVIEAAQDFEFYPTTDEIIRALKSNLGILKDNRSFSSVLDIGAGNGKVLMALKDAGFRDLYAIEKSSILCQELPAEVLIVGTEFAEQSLLSKQVQVIFSNPPYSQFEQWAEKIIRQAAAEIVFLVIPERWTDSALIRDALKFREATYRTVGKFDFEKAEDRTARARVHLLRIDLESNRHGENTDAFERFFKEQFADLIGKFEAATKRKGEEEYNDYGARRAPRPYDSLVVGANYPSALVEIYNQELANIERNYQLVSQLDVSLLQEFEISPDRIMACLKTRLSGLRSDYWNELFSHLSTVTDRLTSKSRKTLLETLHKHVHVDLTVSNICAVMIWVIKNANRYIDSQLIETFQDMVAKCNVVLYKSNKRTWEDERWRYNGDPEKNSHYALDYRIVTHRLGGIRTGYSFEKGLDERAAAFLGDLLSLARNLGFNCSTVDHSLGRNSRENWVSGDSHTYYFTDAEGDLQPLYEVKAFKNGNLHLRLNKKFILALNVEHGRLRGWLRTAAEAVDELQDNQAAEFFKSNTQLAQGNPALLLC